MPSRMLWGAFLCARSQLSGAVYDSARTVGDDDVPADSASSQAIDSRELEVPAHAGETYTLVVAASDSGTFVIILRLVARGGATPPGWNKPDLSLARGQVKRLLVRVGTGKMEVSDLH